jgi:hypothetical protein
MGGLWIIRSRDYNGAKMSISKTCNGWELGKHGTKMGHEAKDNVIL